MKAIRLQTEYMTEPVGIDVTAPRFFWNADGGVKQTAYQIVCTRGGVTVWDSGKVASSRMTHIRYEGEPLRSRDIVEWSVTLWDENGVPGEAGISRFEMGLLAPEDWTAKWISGDYKPRKNTHYPADCFQKTFAVTGNIVRARLYATARGVYDVHINGRRVEDFILAPGMTDYRKRLQVQTYDVTGYIKQDNVMELRLADGWYRGSSAAYGVMNVYGAQTSVLAQLELTMEDGSVQTVATDGSWRWSNDGPLRFTDLKDGEVYDASLTPTYGGNARVVPALKSAKLCASNNVPVTEHERFTPRLLTAPDGTRVLDFGQNLAGYIEFTVKGAKRQRLRLICGEVLGADGHVDMSGIQEIIPAGGWTQMKLIQKLAQNKVNGESTVTPKQEIVFLCSGGEDHYKTSFAVFGFRYAEVDSDITIDPNDFAAVAVYSNLEQTGEFACSDERVNRLLENTRWSMKSNFLDLPTDCPTRERLGWTGDAQVFFDTGAYLMNTAPFFAKWLRDMQDAQYKNGLLPAVLPYQGVEMMYKATGSSVGWADAVYLIPYRYARRFGDGDVAARCWPMMKKYADYLLSRLEKDGHYEKGVHLGEWLEPEEFRETKYGAGMKHPEECTAYLYLAMTTMAELADERGEREYAEKLRAAAQRARAAYPAYAELDTDRQAKLVRPLALGLLDGQKKTQAQERLVQAVRNYRYRVGTGFLSTPFLLPVLTEAGAAETAYRMLLNPERPGWLCEIEAGATTVWEDWEGKLSQNHYSPGAVCGWLFDTVCGIRVSGENRFTIRPVPGGGLTHAEASYNSVYGCVESRWERTDSGYAFDISIPANCEADIFLPDGSTARETAGRVHYDI